jgi:hypothetical protein
MSFSIGFNFRGSAGFVSDPVGTVAVHNSNFAYPQTALGVTFGYGIAPATLVDRFGDRDVRLAGTHRAENFAKSTFRINLPGPGKYYIWLAGTHRFCCRVFDADQLTLRYELNKSAVELGGIGPYYWDAAGQKLLPSEWPLQQRFAEITVTGDHIWVYNGRNTGPIDTSSSHIAHFQIAAADVTLTTVTVEPASATVSVGQQQRFRALANYSDGSSLDITQFATWESDDLTIAEIVSLGVATGIQQGSATITATFNAVSGNATLTVTPLQTIAFDPDWSDGSLTERRQYLTEILKAYDGKEQRRALRKQPRILIRERLITTRRKESAALDAFLWQWQNKRFGIPFWPDQQRLQAEAAAAQNEVLIDTSNRKFLAGGYAMIWADPFTSEAGLIDSVEVDRIVMAAPLNFTWAAGAKVVPVLMGRLSDRVNIARVSTGAGTSELEFICEPLELPAPASAPVTYQGFEVLTAEPNGAHDRDTDSSRSLAALDSGFGKVNVDDRSGIALVKPNGFSWFCYGRSEIALAGEFLQRAFGSLTPFWVPTYQHDLPLAANYTGNATTISIQNVGYTNAFLAFPARRFVAFLMLDGSGNRYYREITGSVDAGTTETLTLDSAIRATDIVKEQCLVSFLTLVRLAVDDPEITWHRTDLCEVALDFEEVPFEVPA